jgi:PAS domain S-box-containing protein
LGGSPLDSLTPPLPFDSERLAVGIADASPDLLVIFSLEQRTLLYANRRLKDLLGVDPDSVRALGTGALAALLHPDDLAIVEHAFKHWDGAPLQERELRLRSAAGEYRVFHSRTVPFRLAEDGSVVDVLSVLQDVTERKQTESELRRLAAAVQHAAEGVMITDADGRIEYVNPAFCRVTGFARPDVLGRTPSVLRSGLHDDGFYTRLWSTLKGDRVWTGRLTNRRADGSTYDDEITISPIRDGEGKLLGYVSLHRDVTRQTQLEAELQHAQKMEAVGRLAGGVAHDFNNIIQAIIGYTSFALEDLPEDLPTRRDLEQVLEVSRRAATLVRQLLVFARREIVQPERLDLAQVIQELAKMLKRVLGEHVELSVTVADDPPHWVFADAGQLEQLLVSLCMNARDAMPAGGTITVSLQRVSLARQDLENEPELAPGRFVELTVADTSPGLDPETLKRVFDPFFDRSAPGINGVGLGLAAVYGIARRHGARIRCHSKLGEGTRFVLHFPLIEENAPSLEPGPPDEPGLAARTHRCVLLAEDDEQIRTIAERALQKAGFVVRTAADGEEALNLFRSCPDDWSVVLLDVVMPRLSGTAVLSKLRGLRPEVPVVLTTGYSFEELDPDEPLDAATVLFAKPYSPRALVRKVQELVDGVAPESRVQ